MEEEPKRKLRHGLVTFADDSYIAFRKDGQDILVDSDLFFFRGESKDKDQIGSDIDGEMRHLWRHRIHLVTEGPYIVQAKIIKYHPEESRKPKGLWQRLLSKFF